MCGLLRVLLAANEGTSTCSLYLVLSAASSVIVVGTHVNEHVGVPIVLDCPCIELRIIGSSGAGREHLKVGPARPLALHNQWGALVVHRYGTLRIRLCGGDYCG